MADVDLAMANGTVVAWVKRITLCLELGNDLLANLKAGLAFLRLPAQVGDLIQRS